MFDPQKRIAHRYIASAKPTPTHPIYTPNLEHPSCIPNSHRELGRDLGLDLRRARRMTLANHFWADGSPMEGCRLCGSLGYGTTIVTDGYNTGITCAQQSVVEGSPGYRVLPLLLTPNDDVDQLHSGTLRTTPINQNPLLLLV